MAKTARVVNAMSNAAKQEDFQAVANQYAHRVIESMREELDDENERERITENALDVNVRSDWYVPGQDGANKPTEYTILLGTGGPAHRIHGELNQYCEPSSAKFEYQDWYKPWTEANDLSDDEEAVLLTYAQQFYFGE